jgi:hypothetical protein
MQADRQISPAACLDEPQPAGIVERKPLGVGVEFADAAHASRHAAADIVDRCRARQRLCGSEADQAPGRQRHRLQDRIVVCLRRRLPLRIDALDDDLIDARGVHVGEQAGSIGIPLGRRAAGPIAEQQRPVRLVGGQRGARGWRQVVHMRIDPRCVCLHGTSIALRGEVPRGAAGRPAYVAESAYGHAAAAIIPGGPPLTAPTGCGGAGPHRGRRRAAAMLV